MRIIVESKPMGDRSIREATDSTIEASADRRCYEYPRPAVAVDTALLTLDPARGLVVLEIWREGTKKWALPGTFVHERETLAEAVERSLRDKVGVRGVRPRQLHVFDHPDRDDRDWVLSVAHVAVLQPDQLDHLRSPSGAEIRLVSVDRPGELVWDHSDIVRLAKQHIRLRYVDKPDPDRFLGSRFTLRELQLVHEGVAGKKLVRDTFRRMMEAQLSETGSTSEHAGARGRPARIFRRIP